MTLIEMFKKKILKTPLIGIIVLFIILGFISFITLSLFFNQLKGENRELPGETKIPVIVTVKINHKLIKAEVVNTQKAKYQGLSDRSVLCVDCGMLFNFTHSKEREFVMRNMKFPLDIIFINQEHIIKIAANLPPAGAKPKIIYNSDGPANQVLEVNGTYTAKQGIKVGDKILIQP